ASASSGRLTKVLEALSSSEIQDFNRRFHEKLCDLNLWSLWGAGYVISGGMGDDAFLYFRSWIIGKGKAVFEVALTNPDELGPFLDTREVDNEGLGYAPLEALKKRGIKEDPRDRSDRSSEDEPEGEPFDEDTVARSFPRLASAVDRFN